MPTIGIIRFARSTTNDGPEWAVLMGAAGGGIPATGGKCAGGEGGVHGASAERMSGGLLGGGSGHGMGAAAADARGGSVAGTCANGGDGAVNGSGATGGA